MDAENPLPEIEPPAPDGSNPEPPPPPVYALDNPFLPPPPEPPPPPPPPPQPPPGTVPSLLAGLESGMLGATVMIAWFALDSLMERQYWWAMLNLWGAGVYHNRVFSMGFGIATLAGGATHFFLHGLGGALWALVAARISGYWTHLLASFLGAAVWYWLLMFAFWPSVAPVVSRITPYPATALAYFLFGAALTRNAYRARQLGLAWQT